MVSTVGYAPAASIAEPHSQTAKKSAAGGQTTLTGTGLGTKTAAKSRASRAKAVVAGQPAIVIVKPGDSLWSIAVEVLHSDRRGSVGRYVERIYKRNQRVIGDDPSLIYPGQRLRLPRVDRISPASLDKGEGAVPARFDRTVRVGRGDTLWSIASRALEEVLTRSEARRVARFLPLVHKSNRSLLVSLAAQTLVGPPKSAVRRYVERIHGANKEVIGPNPNLVYPGQAVELPTVEGTTVTSLTQSTLTRAKEHPREFLGWVRRMAGRPKTGPMAAAADDGGSGCCGRDVARTNKPPRKASVSLMVQPADQDDPGGGGRLVAAVLVTGLVLLLLAWLWWSPIPKGLHALTRTRRRRAEGAQERDGPNQLSPLERRPPARPVASRRAPTDSGTAR